MIRARWLAIATVVLTACSSAGAPTAPVATAVLTSVPASNAPASPAATPAPSTPAPTRVPQKFPTGLYAIRPSLQHPGGIVELVDPAGGTLPRIDIFGAGWDVHPDVIVGPIGDLSGVTLYSPDGTSRQVKVPGLYGMGRPSLSPDAKQVFLQGTETKFDPSAGPRTVFDDTVFVVDLATGAFRRIGDKATGPSTQSEMPLWMSADRLAYWATETGCLVIKVRDVATAQDVVTIRRNGTSGCYQPQRGVIDGPRFHIAASADGTRLLIAGQLQVYDAKTGTLLADVHQKALDGLAAAGYKADARFPGQAGAGTFPIAGTFSPDAKQVVFDGAVEKDGQFGVGLFRINVDGTGFTVHRTPVQVESKFSNQHNYSQILPRWR